jgi:flagellar L-ring protein FlgH
MKPHVKFIVSLACLALSAPLLLAQGKDAAPARRISSWTSDRHDYQVGDVITVLVTETTLASATKTQSGTDQQTRKNALGISPPQMGVTPMPPIDMSVSTNKNASSNQTGDAKRNVSFRGDISVRVVAVDAKTGLLQIKGAKAVDVDKNKQTLNLTGWIRPEDISAQNYVASERVADAQMTYTLTGDIGKTRGGLIGRLVNVFWP